MSWVAFIPVALAFGQVSKHDSVPPPHRLGRPLRPRRHLGCPPAPHGNAEVQRVI